MSQPRHVALIIDATKPYDRKIIGGVARYVKEVGNWSLYVEEDPLQKLPNLHRWPGSGIIANFDDRKVAMAVRDLKVPVVGVGGGYGWYEESARIPYFATDNEAIARFAAEHLLNRGFRHLAFYGYPATQVNGWSQERAVAFQRRAAEAGVPCSVFTGRHGTARRWADLQRGLTAWLAPLYAPGKPLGLMASNDVRARHVLEACHTLGARVPEDVAVIGVDNDDMICDLTNPPLSSIEQGAKQMGYQAAALLDHLMGGEKASSSRFVIAPEGVVARRSTDILAIEDPAMAAAVRLIRANAFGALKIGDVARKVDMSPSSLKSRFKTALGRTVHAEIHRLRLERARELLVETDLPLKQVATRSGFQYIQYLTRLFRRTFGETPAEYRRNRGRIPQDGL